MQIHIEAHLILNINSSVSEFAGKTSPPSPSCHSLLLSLSAKCGRSVWDHNCVAAPLKSVSDEGGSVLVEIRKLKQCNSVRDCPLSPVLLWVWVLTILIRFMFVTDFLSFLFVWL